MMPANHRGSRGETGRFGQVVDTTAPKIPNTLKSPPVAPIVGRRSNNKQQVYNG